jgi:hypothetical protein
VELITHDHTAGEFAYGKATRYRGFDHTLITRGASVGVIGQKRSTCIHLESASYGWFGLVRMARNGFDSRYTGGRSIPRTLIACVSTRSSKKRGMHSGPEFIGLHGSASQGRRIRPPNYPPRNRTHDIQFHLSCLMVVGAAGFEPATSYSRTRGTPLAP